MTSLNTFGDSLRHLRQRARLTQDEFGIAVGYSRAHIARLENNQRLPEPSAVRARFFEPLGLAPDSAEATQLAVLAAAAHDIRSLDSDEPESVAEHQTPNNLPYPVTSFVGRTEALAELQRLLPTTRLLTLTGVGGTGKTRLALELAGRVLDGFPDGVWLVELAQVTDPAQVAQTALTSIGIRDTAGMRPTAALIDVLRNQRCLLILDNCEHVIDACAALADAVLRECRNTTLLATSRESLGIAGEQGWRVPSLSMPAPDTQGSPDELMRHEALQLFVQRARLVSPTFELTREISDAVRQICQRLDGIPLAIELAAARIRAMTAGDIAQRLSDRFRLLTGGSRTVLPRQQTLQALIDWSYRLLTESEQLLFCRLAVFSGGWSLVSAEAICSGDGVETHEVLELLLRLVDKSLVIADNAGAQTRYRFLESVRQFAQDALAQRADGERWRDRHAGYFVDIGKSFKDTIQASDHDQVAILAAFGPELDNIRRALDWTAETGKIDACFSMLDAYDPLFVARSVREEPQTWAEAVLAQARERGNLRLQADVQFQLLRMYLHTDQHDKTSSTLYSLLEIGNSLNDHNLIAAVEHSFLWDAINRQDRPSIDQHHAYWLRALKRADHIDEAQIEANQDGIRTEIALIDGDFNTYRDGARRIYESVQRQAGKMQTSAMARLYGYALILTRELDDARGKFRESLVDNHALGDRHAVAACFSAFAALAVAEHDPYRCARLLGASDAILEKLHTRLMQWDRHHISRTLQALNAQLDAESQNAARADGHAMSLEQAMAYALETGKVDP